MNKIDLTDAAQAALDEGKELDISALLNPTDEQKKESYVKSQLKDLNNSFNYLKLNQHLFNITDIPPDYVADLTNALESEGYEPKTLEAPEGGQVARDYMYVRRLTA